MKGPERIVLIFSVFILLPSSVFAVSEITETARDSDGNITLIGGYNEDSYLLLVEHKGKIIQEIPLNYLPETIKWTEVDGDFLLISSIPYNPNAVFGTRGNELVMYVRQGNISKLSTPPPVINPNNVTHIIHNFQDGEVNFVHTTSNNFYFSGNYEINCRPDTCLLYFNSTEGFTHMMMYDRNPSCCKGGRFEGYLIRNVGLVEYYWDENTWKIELENESYTWDRFSPFLVGPYPETKVTHTLSDLNETAKDTDGNVTLVGGLIGEYSFFNGSILNLPGLLYIPPVTYYSDVVSIAYDEGEYTVLVKNGSYFLFLEHDGKVIKEFPVNFRPDLIKWTGSDFLIVLKYYTPGISSPYSSGYTIMRYHDGQLTKLADYEGFSSAYNVECKKDYCSLHFSYGDAAMGMKSIKVKYSNGEYEETGGGNSRAMAFLLFYMGVLAVILLPILILIVVIYKIYKRWKEK